MNKPFGGIILVVVAAMVFMPSGFTLATDQSSSKVFQSDADFESWTKTDVSSAGVDQGLQLSEDGLGGYKTSGSISYKFSPGGVNNWGAASYQGATSSLKQNQYLWVAIYLKDYVSQIDAATGQVEKEWKVGVDPSRTVVGLNQDAWVANRSGVGYVVCPADSRCQESDFLERLNTVSHIVPRDNKVVTKKVIPGDNANVLRGVRSISVDRQNRIWVGMYNPPQIQVIDGNTFDGSGDADVLATIPLTHLPYGSVFGKNEENLYIPSLGGGITRVNTSAMAVDQYYQNDPDGNPLRMYGISNDQYGNVWGGSQTTSVIIRIDASTLTLKSFPAVFDAPYDSYPIQVAVTPEDKLFTSIYSKPRTIAISQVTNNSPGQVTTIGAFSYESSDCTGGAARGIGFDSNYNIWTAPVGKCVAKFTKASNYQSSTSYPNTTSALSGNSYTYSDFIGNALGNSTTNLDLKYSDKVIDQNNPGVDDPRKLPASEDLYIKVDFSGTRTVSPILRSLTINYDTNFGQRAGLLKTTFSDSSRSQPGATFEKDQKIYVTNELVGLPSYQNQFSFIDEINGAENGSVINFKINSRDFVQSPKIEWLGANQARITFSLEQADLAPNGQNKIDYEYVDSP